MRSHDHLRWEILERRVGTDYGVFRPRVHDARHASVAGARRFAVIDCPDWVNVIAVTPDRQVVLVRQFRHGTESVTVEIPGGAVDLGERHEQAARRELAEETGYRAGSWRQLGMLEPNPALQSNRCSTWLALGAERVGDPHPDEGEQLEVALLPLTEVQAMVRDGRIQHALVVAAFAHLLLACCSDQHVRQAIGGRAA
jgi:ADP-ribose pyrophosphatase